MDQPAAGQPVVVLLHGVGLDSSMWDPLRAVLPGTWQVRALDLLGHGARPAASAGTTLADLADDVVDRMPAAPVHLVGFSLGALVAQHIARHHAARVRTLTSVNSVCRRTVDERQAVLGRLATAGDDFAAGVEASLHRWYDGTGVPAGVVEATRTTLLANDIASYLACYRVFATGDASISAELAFIDVPALAITGQLDPGSTPDMTHRLAAAVPGCRAVVVPGARHMLPVQDPAALAAHVTAIIEEKVHDQHPA